MGVNCPKPEYPTTQTPDLNMVEIPPPVLMLRDLSVLVNYL